MTALEDLKNYGYALQEKRAIERQIERMTPTGAPPGLHGISGGMPATNDRIASALQQLEGLEDVLVQKVQELSKKAIKGEKALEMIAYPKARTIMRRYYMLGEKMRRSVRPCG